MAVHTGAFAGVMADFTEYSPYFGSVDGWVGQGAVIFSPTRVMSEERRR